VFAAEIAQGENASSVEFYLTFPSSGNGIPGLRLLLANETVPYATMITSLGALYRTDVDLVALLADNGGKAGPGYIVTVLENWSLYRFTVSLDHGCCYGAGAGAGYCPRGWCEAVGDVQVCRDSAGGVPH
jgi:hypothetical protein